MQLNIENLTYGALNKIALYVLIILIIIIIICIIYMYSNESNQEYIGNLDKIF